MPCSNPLLVNKPLWMERSIPTLRSIFMFQKDTLHPYKPCFHRVNFTIVRLSTR